VTSLRARGDQRPARQAGSLSGPSTASRPPRPRRELDRLLEIYREAADASNPADDSDHGKKALLYKMCAVHEHRLQNNDRAIDGYLEILSLDENDTRAVSALDAALQPGTHADLAELLAAREIERRHAAGNGWIAARCAWPRSTRTAARSARGHRLLRGASGPPARLARASTPAARDALNVARSGRHRPGPGCPERLVLDEGQRLRIAHILEPLYKEADEWPSWW